MRGLAGIVLVSIFVPLFHLGMARAQASLGLQAQFEVEHWLKRRTHQAHPKSSADSGQFRVPVLVPPAPPSRQPISALELERLLRECIQAERQSSGEFLEAGSEESTGQSSEPVRIMPCRKFPNASPQGPIDQRPIDQRQNERLHSTLLPSNGPEDN